MSNLEGDDDGEENTDQSVQQHKRADQIEIIKYKKHAKKNRGKSWCPFHFYLHQQRGSIREPSTRALHMDDELNRMESKFHRSGNDDLPQLWFPLDQGFDHYNGDIVRPNERSYELVLHAYSKANLGKEGAERAENVLARYEKFNTTKQATTKMMAFVMKAFIAAGDLKRTEYWLNRIEKRYEATQLVSNFPGYFIYNPFVLGLKRMADVSERRAAKLSMDTLLKIDTLHDSASTKQYDLLPGRTIYLETMKYQERGYKGSAAFFRIQEVFRLLQRNYRLTGNNPIFKPSIETVTPVFVAASKCYYPDDDRIIRQVNSLFDEICQLYEETGDPDFCPNATMCNSLNSIYARMNRHKINLTDFMERTTILMERMEKYNVKFKDPRDKTSAFNRILHAAETQLPDEPMSDPLKTKEIFVFVLNTFKQFHDDSAKVIVSPNEATYQIFLRACTKLPEGEARLKLSAKAFQLCKQNNLVAAQTILKLIEANPDYGIPLFDSSHPDFDEDLYEYIKT